MSVRLIVTLTATPGNRDNIIREIKRRNVGVSSEPGCEQFELFTSVDAPDRVVILERWKDQAALNVHAELAKKWPPMPAQLLIESQREDYEYNRTR